MIFDKIENRKTYFKHDLFNKIFDDLKKIDLMTSNGIHFKNEDYYFKVISYKTKIKSEIIENHKEEVDIQTLLSGSEKIKLFSAQNIETIREYFSDDDCQFFKKSDKKNSEIILTPGYMGVFFSQDIHNPQFAVNSKLEEIKKIVIKVNEKFFT